MGFFIHDFARPPKEFYPVPWWCWNGRIEKQELLRQLDLMKQQNISEFFLYATYGLEEPEFLSEEWFALVGFTLQACQKREMKLWIYDELNWPSGAAGGCLLRQHPELREFHLVAETFIIQPGGQRFLDNDTWDMPQPAFAAFRVHDDGKSSLIHADERGFWHNDTALPARLLVLSLVPGERHCLNSNGTRHSRLQRGQLDLLNPEAFPTWVKYVHAEYCQRFSSFCGKTIKGFFFDEPYTSMTADSIPWTATLGHKFRERYGYELIPKLPEIFLDLPDSPRIRRDFFELIGEIISGQFTWLNQWCAERQLLLTGHCICEEILSAQQSMLCRCGDVPRLLGSVSVPGMDLLGNRTSFFPEQEGGCKCWCREGKQALVYTAKQAAAAARYQGLNRVLCEAFGGCDWNHDLGDQKVINDWLAAFGVNLICDASIPYSNAGFLIRGASGKCFEQPWWPLYYLYAQCSARLNFFSALPLETKIALFVPRTSMIAHSPILRPDESPFKSAAFGFNRVADTLVRNQVDFELLFENIFEAQELPFTVIILPWAEYLSAKSAAKLEMFSGKMIIVGQAPRMIIDPLRPFSLPQAIQCTAENFLSSLPPRPYHLEGEGAEDIVAALRRDGNDFYLLLGNQTKGDKKLHLQQNLGTILERLDPESGEITPGKTNFILSEQQSVIFRLASTPAPRCQPAPETPDRIVLTLPDRWHFDFAKKNHFTPSCELRLDASDRGLADRWYLDFQSNPAWLNTWSGNAPFAFAPEESSAYWLRAAFRLDTPIENLALITDGGAVRKLFLNGRETSKICSQPLWDRDNVAFALADICRTGLNFLHIHINTPFWNDPRLGLASYVSRDMLQFALAGDFAVSPAGELISPPEYLPSGSWTRLGFPEFAGKGCYSQNFRLTDCALVQPQLVIEEAACAIEVRLNGQELQPRAWKPWRFNIPKTLLTPENHLEFIVHGALGNLLKNSFLGRTIPKEFGLLGRVHLYDLK